MYITRVMGVHRSCQRRKDTRFTTTESRDERCVCVWGWGGGGGRGMGNPIRFLISQKSKQSTWWDEAGLFESQAGVVNLPPPPSLYLFISSHSVTPVMGRWSITMEALVKRKRHRSLSSATPTSVEMLWQKLPEESSTTWDFCSSDVTPTPIPHSPSVLAY